MWSNKSKSNHHLVLGRMRLEIVIRIQNVILDGESWCLFSNESYEKKSVMTIEDFVLYSNKHFESHLLGNGQGGTSFLLSSPVGMNHSAMGFSLVFQELVPETLGNRCCFRMCLFLFPVSLRINPPPLFPSFLWRNSKKKSPTKKIIFFPRHSKARRECRMTMCSLCMRQLGLLSNAQRTVCLCVTTVSDFFSALYAGWVHSDSAVVTD